jgi:hypothetical protein
MDKDINENTHTHAVTAMRTFTHIHARTCVGIPEGVGVNVTGIDSRVIVSCLVRLLLGTM